MVDTPFFRKKNFFEGTFLQNYSFDFNKIENIVFLYKLYKQTKFDTNQGFWGLKLNKFLMI